ncbi:MAG: glycosyltransferase family 4 protein [Chitinophagaceae bacterium]|nr:glycosyltransferase family 4 protein [Chitinophagaceae bacterium]MBL0271990.1 glycosyltransferase family 4 protein [Chitinophagaceae bacterium]
MGSSKKKIILDCDLMKYPHSGLYHYCLNLGTSVQSLLEQKDEARIAFYVPPAEARSFGPDSRHIVEKKSIWNFFNPFLRSCTIWHAPFQSGRILPDKKKYPGIKILLTIHDLNPLHEGKPPEEQRKSLAHTQSLIDKSDALVCISEFCKGDVLANCKVGNKPVYVVHNGTHKVHTPQLTVNSYQPARPFLFGMGYVNTKKNYHVLLPLLKNEGIELVIAGRLDEPDYIEKIKQQALKMGVSDRLHILGPVTEGEKSWYFKNCLAFVHPSLAEGFGAPVVEVMQFGKPLFLSARTSLPEIGGDAAFYFSSFNEEHIQQVFHDGMIIFEKEKIADRVRKRGMEFDWEEKAKQYLEVYQSLY